MTSPIIEVKNIGKKYNIVHEQGRYIALRDVMMNVIKSPFAFLKKKVQHATGFGGKEEFWALRDINVAIQQGDVVGIIGKNGSGKSTLLKILSQITPPTEGEARVRGRVGSLLEVGTGFHPELTGRENIFLNGAILGMKRMEIARKFDEIVAFAGVEKFLDTPVKHFSSGMYVRLAFSVAAHMDSDILIVDEVLAVGDAEFQEKCLAKMEEITKDGKRTILFVSHNMTAVKKLCKKCILLEKGRVKMYGDTEEVGNYYLNHGQDLQAKLTFTPDINKKASITGISLLDTKSNARAKIAVSEPFVVEVKFEVHKPLTKTSLCITIFTRGEILLYSTEADRTGSFVDYAPGKYLTRINIPAFLLNIGYYYLQVGIERPFVEGVDVKTNIPFEIIDRDNPRSVATNGRVQGMIASQLSYDSQKIS